MCPFRNQHSCMIDDEATEIVEVRSNKTKWGELKVVMARKGNKVVVRSLRIPGIVPVNTAQQLCATRGGKFSPATPLNPQAQLLSEEYCFFKLPKDGKVEVLNALVEDFVPPLNRIALGEVMIENSKDLPDDSFALVLSGGIVDDTGKTVPRSLRKLVYKNQRGVIDKACLSEALSKIHLVEAPADLKRKALLKLLRAAKTVGLKTENDGQFRFSDLVYYLENLEKLGG